MSAHTTARQLGDRSDAWFFPLKIFWVLMPVCWLIQTASYPNSIGPDGISYLDIAAACAKGNWRALINAYWSPAYSASLGVWFWIVRPSPDREVLSVQLFNCLLLIGTLVCLEVFLSSLCAYLRQRDATNGSTHLPAWAIKTIGFVLFFWVSLYMTPPSLDTPDAMVLGIVLLAGALLLRIASGKNGWLRFALLGAVLGCGYLAKAVMFPLALVFILFSVAAEGSVRRAIPRLLPCLLAFALISGPFIFALSKSKGRFTFNDPGAIAYAEYVNGTALFVHWQGGPPDAGEPKHPERKVFDLPTAYEYATPVGGSYPPWTDPSYWYDGVTPHFQLGNQLNAMRLGFDRYLDIFSRLGAVFAGFLVLLFWSRDTAGFFRRLLRLSFLWGPALAAFGLYSLVHVEDRFLPAFTILLLVSLFAGIRVPPTEPRTDAIRGPIWAVTAILGLQIAWSIGHSVVRLTSQRAVPEREIVSALNANGVAAGDRVSFLGNAAFDHYWAHLGHFIIVAEIPEAHKLEWAAASPETRTQVMNTLAKFGSKAMVTQDLPAQELAEGWQRIGTTNYYLLLAPH
jgi:hypothetical protein